MNDCSGFDTRIFSTNICNFMTILRGEVGVKMLLYFGGHIIINIFC